MSYSINSKNSNIIKEKTQEEFRNLISQIISNISVLKTINLQKDGDIALFTGFYFFYFHFIFKIKTSHTHLKF